MAKGHRGVVTDRGRAVPADLLHCPISQVTGVTKSTTGLWCGPLGCREGAEGSRAVNAPLRGTPLYGSVMGSGPV